jgi:hypothetical protein
LREYRKGVLSIAHAAMNPTRVRIFNSNAAEDLEQKVNEWLLINPDIQVELITQSESGKLEEDWAVTLTIVYRESTN